jgi:Fe-S cluster biogenesis protein NfuA
MTEGEAGMRERVERAVGEIRAILRADGGDIELLEVTDGGTVKVHLKGTCPDCPGALMTLRQGVEKIIQEQVPGVKEVLAL